MGNKWNPAILRLKYIWKWWVFRPVILVYGMPCWYTVILNQLALWLLPPCFSVGSVPNDDVYRSGFVHQPYHQPNHEFMMISPHYPQHINGINVFKVVILISAESTDFSQLRWRPFVWKAWSRSGRTTSSLCPGRKKGWVSSGCVVKWAWYLGSGI